MKKGILIIGTLLIISTLMAVGYSTKSKQIQQLPETKVAKAVSFDDNFVNFINAKSIPDVIYNIDSRFIHKITKADLHKAANINDIFPAKATKNIKHVNETRVTLIEEDGEVIEWGSGVDLNVEQRKLLQSMDYSRDFYLEAYCTDEYSSASKIVYFVSIIPETEATYEGGLESLLAYLEMESESAKAGVKQDALRPGRISFTISKEGKVIDVNKNSSSGFEEFDESLFNLMQNLPKKWTPASDAEGNPVDQSLVLFFGIQGC